MSTIPSAGDDTLDGNVNAPDLLDGLGGNDLIRGNGAGVGGIVVEGVTGPQAGADIVFA